MFMHLRHMPCQIIVISIEVNDDNGVLQLIHWLDAAARLEALHLHMSYLSGSAFFGAEVAGVEGPYMCRHDHLKTVFMSGFQCHKSQIELAYSILGNAFVLEQLTIEPSLTKEIWGNDYYRQNRGIERILPGVCEWAQLTSKRFGKVITVLDAPLHSE